MADSPLSEINWDNLEGQSLVTAVNLLQLAFAERVNMASLIGPFRFNGTNRRVLDMFPFFDNSPDVGKPNWPAMWGPHVPRTNWNLVLASYLSQTKLNSILGTTFPIISLRDNQFTMDSDTLITDLGRPLTGNISTEYPRMDIINEENVKFWYDAITSLKHIMVDFSEGGAGSNSSSKFLSSWTEGIYTPARSEIFYGFGGPFPPFSQLPTDWSQIWTGPVSKQLVVASSPNWHVSYDYISSGAAAVRSMNTYSRFDISDFDLLGHGGEPKEVLSYGGYMLNGTGAEAQSWFSSNGITGNLILQFPNANRTVLAGSIIERNIPLSTPSLPNHDPTIDFNSRSAHWSFEDWDYDGGFEFFTPTP
jgi:hypothetical protein